MDAIEVFEALNGKIVFYEDDKEAAKIVGHCGEKYLILGYCDDHGCIKSFNEKNVTIDDSYRPCQSYRFAKVKHIRLEKQ